MRRVTARLGEIIQKVCGLGLGQRTPEMRPGMVCKEGTWGLHSSVKRCTSEAGRIQPPDRQLSFITLPSICFSPLFHEKANISPTLLKGCLFWLTQAQASCVNCVINISLWKLFLFPSPQSRCMSIPHRWPGQVTSQGNIPIQALIRPSLAPCTEIAKEMVVSSCLG